MKIFLSHSREMRQGFYSDRAVGLLRGIAEVVLHDGAEPIRPDALARAAQDVDIIISDRRTEAPAAVFTASSRLKAFLRCAVDTRNIDIAAASDAGVLVTQAPATFQTSVSELALGYMIDLSRGISRHAAANWGGMPYEARMGRELGGSVVGIIGFGSIGRRLARLCLALDMTVLVNDPFIAVDDPQVEQVALTELLGRAHFVICLVVANDETENLISTATFAAMRPDAVFINLSRGGLVDDAALVAALREGRIAGAALDVGRGPDQRPLPEVAALPNVIATPHIGGFTQLAAEGQALATVEQARLILAGEVPDGALNAAHWTRRHADG